jgi:hypothetical protein
VRFPLWLADRYPLIARAMLGLRKRAAESRRSPVPAATSSPLSAEELRQAISLGSQMASSDALVMLAMKVRQDSSPGAPSSETAPRPTYPSISEYDQDERDIAKMCSTLDGIAARLRQEGKLPSATSSKKAPRPTYPSVSEYDQDERDTAKMVRAANFVAEELRREGKLPKSTGPDQSPTPLATPAGRVSRTSRIAEPDSAQSAPAKHNLKQWGDTELQTALYVARMARDEADQKNLAWLAACEAEANRRAQRRLSQPMRRILIVLAWITGLTALSEILRHLLPADASPDLNSDTTIIIIFVAIVTWLCWQERTGSFAKGAAIFAAIATVASTMGINAQHPMFRLTDDTTLGFFATLVLLGIGYAGDHLPAKPATLLRLSKRPPQ